VWGLVAALVAVVALLPLVPSVTYASVPSGVPPFFTSAAVHRIPPESVVLNYPYPIDPVLQGMLAQAEAGMRYKIVGGSAFVPDASGDSTFAMPVLPPPAVYELFVGAYSGAPPSALPSFDASTFAQIRVFLRTYRIDTVVVFTAGVDPALVRRYLTAAIGRPSVRGPTSYWFGVVGRVHGDGPA
jgi:hypothetical protein